MLQRLNLALRHQRVQLQRQARTRHHLIHGRGQCHWQAHATIFGCRRHPDPATLGDCRIAIGKTWRSANNPILEVGRMQIAIPLQRGQNLFAHLGSFGQDRINHIAAGLRKSFCRCNLAKAGHMLHQKAKVICWCAIRHLMSPTILACLGN